MLTKCPECGHEVSTYAETCPHCGCKIKEYIKQKDAVEELAPYAHRRLIGLLGTSIMCGFFGIVTLSIAIACACNVSERLNSETAPWVFAMTIIFHIFGGLCFLLWYVKYKSAKEFLD